MKINDLVEKYRIITGQLGSAPDTKTHGAFLVPTIERNKKKKLKKAVIRVIMSIGMGWDHVSVSLQTRCPTWNEMNYIKNLFFDETEVAFQFHPKKTEYVNHHPYCLHLWRSHSQKIITPPTTLIGPKS